jgi:hypothetical protein
MNFASVHHYRQISDRLVLRIFTGLDYFCPYAPGGPDLQSIRIIFTLLPTQSWGRYTLPLLPLRRTSFSSISSP